MHYCAMIKWIFVASAAIFSLCVVETLKVQISGDVRPMTHHDLNKALVELNKVASTPAALSKPSEKFDLASSSTLYYLRLQVLLARTKVGKEPDWETAQKSEVSYDWKYKFDFEVTDPDNVGTQYTWGFAADSRIFELQTLSKQPMTLRVLKNTTKQIDINVCITGQPSAGLPIKLELVKLVDPTATKNLQTQYGQTKQITLYAVETLKVQISGDIRPMTHNDLNKALAELNKVASTPAALSKPSEKFDLASSSTLYYLRLQVLLARTKVGKEPDWETAQKSEVSYDWKYKFDFEVTEPDNVGTQYTWGFVTDSRIFELQTLSKQPMTLRVLKNTTKQIDINVCITGQTTVGLRPPGLGVKLELVKLLDPTMTKDLQIQYGQTKQIAAKPPLEEEPKQVRNPISDDRKALWNGTAAQKKGKAHGNAGGNSMEEQDRIIEIAQHLGDVWSKLLLARVLSDNADFSGDCNGTAEKVQELADEMTHHHDMNVGNMKEKAKSALINIETLKDTYKDLINIKIAEYLNEMFENSHEILKKIDELLKMQVIKQSRKGIEWTSQMTSCPE